MGSYIILNNIPICVFNITKLSAISSIGEKQYLTALKMYALSLGAERDDVLPGGFSQYDLYNKTFEHRNRIKKDGDEKYKFFKPYHLVLDFIEEAYFAVSGEHIYYAETRNRFKEPKEINWKILPEAWFFGVFVCGLNVDEDTLDSKMFTGERDDLCLYSKIYLNYSEVESKYKELAETIKTIKETAPKFEI